MMQHAVPTAQSEVFQYGYLTLTCQASLSPEGVEVKQGIRTFRVPFAQVRHFYVQRTGAGQYETLLVATEPAPGKKKIFRFYANAGQPQFHALASALAARVPHADRRALSPKDAMKAMGARDVETITILVICLLIPLIIGFALIPKLIHGLDDGKARVKLSQLEKGKALDSHNVAISGGVVAADKALSVTTVSKRNGVETGRSTKFYVPLVSKNWDESDPVKVVLETKELSSSEMSKLEDADVVEGIVRDVWWEGLGSKQADYLRDKMHLKLDKDVILVEYKADPGSDLMVFGLAFGISTGVMLIIGVSLVVKRKLAR